eukprot:2735224-Rhodomonas_salina.3
MSESKFSGGPAYEKKKTLDRVAGGREYKTGAHGIIVELFPSRASNRLKMRPSIASGSSWAARALPDVSRTMHERSTLGQSLVGWAITSGRRFHQRRSSPVDASCTWWASSRSTAGAKTLTQRSRQIGGNIKLLLAAASMSTQGQSGTARNPDRIRGMLTIVDHEVSYSTKPQVCPAAGVDGVPFAFRVWRSVELGGFHRRNAHA